MNLSWLKDFIAVTERGHFSQASEDRHITHSALSRRIKSLEDWAGTCLLDRSVHPIKLTPAGQKFIGIAKEVVYKIEKGKAVMTNTLAIITTGGTIDKIHDSIGESLTFSDDQQTQLNTILEVGKCYFPQVTQLLRKDSLDFNDEDREAILEAVLKREEKRIVITHGTSTMEKTAQFLESNKIANKTIVLTGAMRPNSIGNSDAGFNVGGAIIAAQILPAGVYGVMNGKCFSSAELAKNLDTGRFDI